MLCVQRYAKPKPLMNLNPIWIFHFLNLIPPLAYRLRTKHDHDD